MDQKQHTVYLLSLGCAKNLVDAEVMSGALRRDKFVLTDQADQAETIIVNTCGFIEAAKAESIHAILELAKYKQEGRCRALLAVGCMAEKYADEMREAMPELDGCCGSHDYQHIGRLAAQALGLDYHAAGPGSDAQDDPYLLRELQPGAVSAYLKIAEGCDNCCSYCLIPQLRGPYCSRPKADILAEAARLHQSGVRELVLIAQDTTVYGRDLPAEQSCDLAQLLDELARLPFAMIRLLYAYPEFLDERVLAAMARHENICNYLDMPIQHGSDQVLARMNRRGDSNSIREAVRLARQYMPDIALRTTVMVGFPGETQEDLDRLLALLQELRFDWLGCFPYYQEEDTPAAGFAGQLQEQVKQQRLDRVMRLSAHITQDGLERFKGQSLSVLAEQPAPDFGQGFWQGRSQYQAPEVDGLVYFHSKQPLEYGRMYTVKIEDCQVYDLIGVVEART